MITRWMHDKQTSIRSEIEGQLHAPELVDVHRPSVDSAADVRAAYRPQGVGGLPAGPGSGQPSGAADIIEAGKAELEGPRTAAQTLRGQRVQGAAEVQGEESSSADRCGGKECEITCRS